MELIKVKFIPTKFVSLGVRGYEGYLHLIKASPPQLSKDRGIRQN